MCLKQRWNESGEPGKPGESNESGDLKSSFLCKRFWNRGSFIANVFETKME
jgi:hypothetical protein